MTTCPNCGIEMEPGYDECPLCHYDLSEKSQPRKLREPAYPSLDKPLSGKEKSNLFWELSSILLFSSLIVVFLIDLMLNKQPEWSWYAMAAIAATFIYITLLVFAYRRMLVVLTGIFLTTAGLLYAIDILHEGLNWFLVPALPLVAFFFLLFGLVVRFARITSHKGLNIVAVASVAIGLYVMAIEICLGWVDGKHISLSWSVIVAASLLPFALILLYYHYRLKRGTNLRKFFHL
ncbi:MAG: DUF6320 domain-containing protein [Bacteroidota bacterium]